MRKTITLALACFALASLAAFAAPILPTSDLGLSVPVAIDGSGSWRPYPILSGGGFAAIVNGVDPAIFYCVDDQNHIGAGDSYIASIVALAAWPSGQDAMVRKGTVSSWWDGGSLTPLQRYQAAAWLADGYSGLAAGSGPATANDNLRQQAIWDLLRTSDAGTGTSSNAFYTAAISAIMASPTYDFGKWAVVSGTSKHSVEGGAYLGEPTFQTFLVQLDSRGEERVPEPASFGLLGLGLTGLWALRRRS
jgi:hypothetical protein